MVKLFPVDIRIFFVSLSVINWKCHLVLSTILLRFVGPGNTQEPTRKMMNNAELHQMVARSHSNLMNPVHILGEQKHASIEDAVRFSFTWRVCTFLNLIIVKLIMNHFKGTSSRLPPYYSFYDFRRIHWFIEMPNDRSKWSSV